ncbi:RNA polymerase sigma factor [Sphingorhabdus contaminans]|uniref:RNA polymerase sigma factor n=1 Tax=Sphingorhabdus contaminans TaxID=1343899 RepID=UPI003D2BA8ED
MKPVTRERAIWLGQHILPHEAALRAWLSRKTVQSLDVDDIVQECYAILASLESVAHVSNPRAYLFRTAYSLILQHVRRSNVVSIQAIEDLQHFEARWDAPSPEDEVSSRRELQRLVDFLETLPARCREAFQLRRIEGMSQREIAQHMGLSENTVEKHIGKALRALAQAYGNGGKRAHRASDDFEFPDAGQDEAERKE